MGSSAEAERRGRRRRRAVALLVVAGVIAPAVRDQDGFPLSTHPMYATAREEVAVLGTAVGVDGQGVRHRLSMAAIARTDDPLIAESAVRDALRRGRAQALCAAIAGRVGSGVEVVEVVEETHDVVRRATGEPSLRDRRVAARCEVVR